MKIFLNLTNGLEAIQDLSQEEFSLIRIQSTSIERKNWTKLFGDLDHNFLFNIVIGTDCHVYDAGASKVCSKTIYYGLPLIEYILNKLWFNNSEAYRFDRSGQKKVYDVAAYYEEVFNFLFKFNKTKEKSRVQEKLKYYNKFAPLNKTGKIQLTGHSFSTKNDGNSSYYVKIIENWIARNNSQINS